MKPAHLVVIMMVFILVAGIPAYSTGMDSGDPDLIMDAADKAINEGELDRSIEQLEEINRDGLSDKSLSRLDFLLGKAKYINVITDIRACRAEGTQAKSELQEHQVGPLKAALKHLETSYELFPDSEWAPEALYASGLIQGYGCLQRFEDAAESYRILAEKYPDTELGKAAAKRYQTLKSKFDNKGHGKPAKSHP